MKLYNWSMLSFNVLILLTILATCSQVRNNERKIIKNEQEILVNREILSEYMKAHQP